MYYDKKVVYATEESFNTAMKSRGLLVEVGEGEEKTLEIAPPLLALVRDIKVVETPATFDEDGNIVSDAVMKAGYHCDLRLSEDISFGDKEVTPVYPAHKFL